MQPISELKEAIIDSSSSPSFIHHKWFVKYHLEIVDQIADELLTFYPSADSTLVKALVWIHDYGKTIDFDNQYELTLIEGRKLLDRLGFDPKFTNNVIEYMTILDKKMELNISESPIEVQIVSTADGCSHYVGPFMNLWWWENAEKPYEELMEDNYRKAEKDWNRKIVLPEAREAFKNRHSLILEQSGDLPISYFT